MTAPKSTSRTRRRGWRDWLFGGSDGETEVLPSEREAPAESPERIGHYQILRKLGQGGMGVVYAARDDRLGRTLAIKTVLGVGADETARRRFWREARAAASVNHPNICQLYEVGEDAAGPFIAMELLEGESLADRLRRGPLGLSEVVSLGLEVLSALGALHARGIVHRDLKPSNVFATPHGVKLLDFGLARSLDEEPGGGLSGLEGLTRSGALVGTPRYMAPEQINGQPLTPATDLFALAAILFEALTGRPAFQGRTAVESLYATLHEQPPALSGGPAVAALDRVIRRALAKTAAARYPSAEAMAAELRALRSAEGGDVASPVRAITRLIVLPFRMLRADPETDFLGFGLADAITTSLVGVPSLLVRSPAAGARFAGESPDLKLLAAEADVDLVLMGTLLRAGDQLRAATQLVEARSGTVTRSHQVQAPLGDVFALQDELARRIVDSVSLPLPSGAGARAPDVPHSPRAYEFYLRANELGRDYDQLRVARDLYLRCVEEDPGYAPAWARLGRCHRVIGKYLEEPDANLSRAEAAFKRALELNPSLPIAHKLYAHLEAEQGRAREAMLRLVGLAQQTRNDPELFAGLVLTCRYCGLLEASQAAHAEARRLDPHVPTSVAYTLWQAGDYEGAIREADVAIDSEPKILALEALGRREEALQALDRVAASRLPPVFRAVIDALGSLLAGRRDETLAKLETAILRHRDPEALYLLATFMARVGDGPRTHELLEAAVAGGFWPVRALALDPAFSALRSEPAFVALHARAETGRREAGAAFEEAGGNRLLGCGAPPSTGGDLSEWDQTVD